jgi:hypothetical protein
MVNSIISEAWKKAEELKKEKERQKKLQTMRLISPRGVLATGSDKENAKTS